MLTLRGQRLLNNLLGGALTSATLETELADAGAKFALRELLDGSPRHARMLLANATARTAVLASATARGILVDCRAALMVASRERDILLALAADATTRNAINASTVALRAIATSDSGAVTWAAQVLNVPGLHTADAEWLFTATGTAYAGSAPVLFLMAVNPSFAMGLARAGKGSGAALKTAANASMTGANTLFTKQASAGYQPQVTQNAAHVLWGDEAIVLLDSYITQTSSGAQYGAAFAWSPDNSAEAVQWMTINNGAGSPAFVDLVAPRGLRISIRGMILGGITVTSYTAK